MTRKLSVLLFVLGMICILSLSAFADQEADTSAVIGSWMLDKVYENASAADRFVLDPENAAALYAQRENSYVFFADGTAEMTMEEITMSGKWEYADGSFMMAFKSPDAPDEDPGYEFKFDYDAEQNVLHQYWKDDDPEATYHDLDFVFGKIPQGDWVLTKVYSGKPGQESVLRDPESSQSLYAESINCYTFDHLQVVNTYKPEEEVITEKGTLKRSGDGWLAVFEDGFEMQLTYDAVNEVLHRYFAEPGPDGETFDFVYEHPLP